MDSHETLGKYRLLERIGKGATGAVYRAWDESLGEVAIKLLSADLTGDASARERFMREARVAAALDHPNIIDIHGTGQHDDRPYIVMELLYGEDLKTLIRRGDSPSLERRLELMEQVVDALAYAHRAGVAHRDIKPENIFVTRSGDVRILDFGIARISDSTMTATGVIIGTPAYMSPEQVSGKKVDSRSDVFSVGSVFYELLTGQRAFPGRVDDVFDKILHAQPAPVHVLDPLIPVELSEIVSRAMLKEPALRYQSMEDMQRALKAFDSALPRLHEVARREAVVRNEHTDSLPDPLPTPGPGGQGVDRAEEHPGDGPDLSASLHRMKNQRDGLDDLIDELTWVAQVSSGSLDQHSLQTLRGMANRVDDIRQVWPDEPSVCALGRRLLEELRARTLGTRRTSADRSEDRTSRSGRPV